GSRLMHSGAPVAEQATQVRRHECPREEVLFAAVAAVHDDPEDAVWRQRDLEFLEFGQVRGDLAAIDVGEWLDRIQVVEQR
ncbi:MAG: hypothetical protein QOH56_4397, partial [Pseudonocardiales bacterium]|nr:hypothetical protein [Pseudonocardiales bacterium]